MDATWKNIIWQQFGAAIGTLENAMAACPEKLWSDRTKKAEFWYVTLHTLFWLDFYLSESIEGFTPPAPFPPRAGFSRPRPNSTTPKAPTLRVFFTFERRRRGQTEPAVLATWMKGQRRMSAAHNKKGLEEQNHAN